jgi:FMN phosphatase YigB (HAD superfamily)
MSAGSGARGRGAAVAARAAELGALLDEHAPRIKVLSLDCFDTLLWRRTATPVDVFYDLQHAPAFADRGLNARLRMRAEGQARAHKKLRHGRSEVGQHDIYRAAYPELDEAGLEALSEAELAAEIDACHAFPATLELIRSAKARGLTVIIVSDTYLSEARLRRLLGACLPSDVYAAIDHVFCSCEHGRSKADGLFEDVLARLRMRPESVLHVGDNPVADHTAPTRLGMRAVHLVHHDAPAAELLRLQATALALLDPKVRHEAALPSPFHGLLAAEPPADDVESLLGYATLGAILYPFGRFIVDEIEALRRAGKRPKALFLMRDAYLPQRVCEAIVGGEAGHAVSISRFAAYASSFRSADDIERYLAAFAPSKRFPEICRQLLLPESQAKSIVAAASKKNDALGEFVRRIRRHDVTATIIERSRRYRERLYRYLESTVGLEAGDTLVFVDLGYEGTAQRLLEPVLRDERQVEVVGRYLLVVGTPGWERSRKGLIDPSWCDERSILSLVTYIALLETLCCADSESVIDYADDGTPRCAPSLIDRDQSERVKPLQEACVAFARAAQGYFAAAGKRPPQRHLAQAAFGQLGRLLYLPTEREVGYLERFRLDMNLATDDTFRLFDGHEGLSGLRRRGLFFMDKSIEDRRMNYPFELRYAGLELTLTLLAQERYRFSLVQSDFSLRREELPVLVARGAESSLSQRAANVTHDGYFSLTVPLGEGDMNVAVLFGRRYAFVQLESVELIPTGSLLRDDESRHRQDIASEVMGEGMIERAPGLFECSADAFLLVPARAPSTRKRRYACRIVFRPIAPQRAASEPALATAV